MARKPIVSETEVVPEADRLEGFPHPRETVMLHGHTTAIASFHQGWSAGRLHHGWLIGGLRGIGKATLAYRLARFVLADEEERTGDGIDVVDGGRTARQVLALSHPRLLVIRRPYDPKTRRFAASIPIDEVRRIRGFLSHAATPGAFRVVIVDQADELNGAAANALLKALEEPPALTVFLLISSEPGRLLATIRSRCRRLDLAPLGDEDLRCAVGQGCVAADVEMPDGEGWAQLVGISRGSVRRALQLSLSGGVGLQNTVVELISGLPKVDWRRVHGLCDELTGAGSEQKFEIFFELLLDTVAQIVRAKAVGRRGDVGDGLERVVDDSRIGGWAELWERVLARKGEAAALNLDRRALVVETLGRLQAIAR